MVYLSSGIGSAHLRTPQAPRSWARQKPRGGQIAVLDEESVVDDADVGAERAVALLNEFPQPGCHLAPARRRP